MRRKMIMTPQAGDKLMSLMDVSEMVGIPVHTLYRWRSMGEGQPAIGLAVMSGIAERP
jgi:hypothetical protein